MAYGRGLSRWRVVIPLALLGMIFMRLIWMQLRTYAFSQDSRAIIALEFLHDRVDDRCKYAHFFPEGSSGPSNAAAGSEARKAESRQGLTRAWLTSVGYALEGLFLCRQDWLEDRPVARLNQWVFTGTVLLAVLMTRFIASNWTVALAVGAMLLSRGSLLSQLGSVSADGMIGLLITAWLAAGAHFLRTGATASLVGMGGAVAFASVYERSLMFLCMPPVLLLGAGYIWRRRLARPVIKRFRGARQRQMRLASSAAASLETDTAVARIAATVRWMAGLEFPPVRDAEPTDYRRGGLFRTIQAPFLLWVYSRKRWTKLAMAWVALLALLILVGIGLFGWVAGPVGAGSGGGTDAEAARLFAAAFRHGLGSRWYEGWIAEAIGRFDLHLWGSLTVMVVCAAQSPAAGLAGFLELIWLAMATFVVILIAALGADALDAALVLTLGKDRLATAMMLDMGHRPVVAWFEPAILSLGAAGVYNLMKVLDSRFADKT